MAKFPVYIQFDARDCGPTCLQMIASYYGRYFSLKTLRNRCYINKNGVSLLGISEGAESIGLRTLGVRVDVKQLLNEIALPCIVHWKQNHFVVVYDIQRVHSSFLGTRSSKAGVKVCVADPALGKIKYDLDEFMQGWISNKKGGLEYGHCLLVEPSPEFHEQEEEKSSGRGLRRLASFVWPYRKLVYQLICGFLISSIFSLLFPLLTQAIVDQGIKFHDLSFLTLVLIAQLTLTIGAAMVGFIRGWIMLHLTSRVNVSLISNFLARLMRLPMSFFESKMAGDIIQRIEDNGRIQNFLTSTVLNLVFSLANFIIFSVIIATYSMKLLSIFLIGSIAYILWIKFFLRYRKELDNRRFVQMSGNQNSIIQLITGMHEIKLNNCENQKRWEWQRIQASLFKISIKGLIIGQYQNAGAVLINGIKNFTITYFAAKAVVDGEMTLGMMLSVQYIIGQMNAPIESMIGFMQSWLDAKLSMERLNDIDDAEFEDAQDEQKLTTLPEEKTIFIKDLSFKYSGDSRHVLENVSFSIPQNKITAIVGASGSGKTTLLKLLLGFYPHASGTISIGGAPLHQIRSRVWREHVGSVMQDGFIFSDTIANNIAIGEELPDLYRLHKAATIANIDDFVKALPLGYNTKIGSLGNGLSQGQRQRILIARVVYKNPEFVFLDEATNALDANNEKEITSKLNHFFKEKTVVIVAHRLSTVRYADNIIVLEKGRVVEQGTHIELTGLNGRYFDLVRNQLELN